MSERVAFVVEMELDSDGIFGSGYSIPGGDDINTTIDKQGYPYLKGSTLKGLLAESLYNLLAWTGGSEADYTALMGEEGWNGTADERRVQLTDMTLISRPVQPEEVFSSLSYCHHPHHRIRRHLPDQALLDHHPVHCHHIPVRQSMFLIHLLDHLKTCLQKIAHPYQ